MRCLTLLVSVFCVCLSTLSFAQVGSQFADIGLNKDIFYPPDRVEIWVRGANAGLEMPVDIYLSVRTPDGRELYAPTFTEMGCPWVHNIVLPQGFTMDWTRFYTFTVPSAGFPLATPGHYVISLWLCAAGSENRLTLGSSQQFTIAPCDRRTWMNDNYIYSLKFGQDALYMGLSSGVKRIPLDGGPGTTWGGQEGMPISGTLLFDGFEGQLAAAGYGVGVSLIESYGWRTVLNSPGTPNYVSNVRSVVRDPDNTIWICHQWYALREFGLGLVRFYPSGVSEDYTARIPEDILYTTYVGDGLPCVITQNGVYAFNGDTFDFHENPMMIATTSSLSLTDCVGDNDFNIWVDGLLQTESGSFRSFLQKWSLLTQQSIVYYPGDLQLPSLNDSCLALDSTGNVWLGAPKTLIKFTGDGFTSFPVEFDPWAPAFGLDGKIYCGTLGRGLWVYDGGTWTSQENLTPGTPARKYAFAVGLGDGGCILTRASLADRGIDVLEYDGRFHRKYDIDPDMKDRFLFGYLRGKYDSWAWGFNRLFREGESDLEAVTDWPYKNSMHGALSVVGEAHNGDVYAGTAKSYLFYYDREAATWSTLESPSVGHGLYTSMHFDNRENMYLLNYLSHIDVRHPDGSWTRWDDTNVLPGAPYVAAMSDVDVYWVVSYTGDFVARQAEWYLTAIHPDGQAKSYRLEDFGSSSVAEITVTTFDLAGRLWMMGQTLDGAGLIIVMEPESELFRFIPWSSGMMPTPDNHNMGQVIADADRSFRDMGILWWLGYYETTRLNLAPRTEILLDKAAYSWGEAMRVDAYFANQAGSIPIDWYAAVEDEQGNLFYWPTYTQAKTPAFQGLLVPTDTAFIMPLDNIVIPGDVPPGHYKWKTGFKRAGQETWLGLGFTATGEFDVTAKP